MKLYRIDDISGDIRDLKVKRNAGKTFAPPHKHDFAEIIYIYNGKGVHEIDGIVYDVCEGDLLFVNTGETHSYHTEERMEFYEILVKSEFFRGDKTLSDNIFAFLMLTDFSDFDKEIKSASAKVSFDKTEGMTELFKALDRENKGFEAGSETAVRSYLSLILVKLFRKLSKGSENALEKVNSDFLEYIKSHCDEKLTLSDMAKEFLYNPSYFSRLFKTYSGMNFSEYVQRARVEKAADLLERKELSVDDVAEMSGFSNITVFYKKFRQFKGCLPAEYRKK